jgi:lactose/L-arabinose transport system ATP-binding protein
MAQLEIAHVSKSFGDIEVLRDVNLQIASGEFVVFVGPSGCGKSTLLRMISGLEEIGRGEIRLDGQVINDIDPARRGVAMVFQSYALYPHMSAFDNIAFSLKMARSPKPTILEKVAKAAGILRLEALLARRPGALSGGQKQRVAIGRAIVREPKVFLFDEPLSNLDAELRVQMRAELMQLHDRLATTMIYVTHDQVEAMTLADKMVVMNGGVVQQCGRPLDLYDDPDNMFVAGFIGSPRMNFAKANVVERRSDSITVEGPGIGRTTLPFRGFGAAAGLVNLGVRPEHVRLQTADQGAATEQRVVWPCSFAFAEELGDVTYVHGDLPSGERVVLRSFAGRYAGAKDLAAAVDPAQVLLFDESGRRLRPERSDANVVRI